MTDTSATDEYGEQLGDVLGYYLESRNAWYQLPTFRFAMTPGGARIHRRGCTYIQSTVATAEKVIDWMEGRAAKPAGNVPYPVQHAVGPADCRICSQSGDT